MRILSLFIILLFVCFFEVISQDKDCWPSYRSNPALTGYTDVNLPDQLDLLWTYNTGDNIKSSPAICDRKIFIGSNDGYVYSLSKQGKLIWKYNAETSVEAPVLYLDNTIFVGSVGGDLFALNSKTGELNWKYTTDGQILGSSGWITSPDGKSKRILTGSYDFYLHWIIV